MIDTSKTRQSRAHERIPKIADNYLDADRDVTSLFAEIDDSDTVDSAISHGQQGQPP